MKQGIRFSELISLGPNGIATVQIRQGCVKPKKHEIIVDSILGVGFIVVESKLESSILTIKPVRKESIYRMTTEYIRHTLFLPYPHQATPELSKYSETPKRKLGNTMKRILITLGILLGVIVLFEICMGLTFLFEKLLGSYWFIPFGVWFLISIYKCAGDFQEWQKNQKEKD